MIITPCHIATHDYLSPGQIIAADFFEAACLSELYKVSLGICYVICYVTHGIVI